EAQGYPEEKLHPSVAVDGADVIHLAYISAEGLSARVAGRIAYRSSADGFAAAAYAYSSLFTVQDPTALAVDAGGTRHIAGVSSQGSIAGLSVYRAPSGSGTFARTLASSSLNGAAMIDSDAHGKFWLSYLSEGYCARTGACKGF